jgi:hypothetical protein
MDDQELVLAVLTSDPARFNRIKPSENASAGLLSAVGASHEVSLRWIQGVFPCPPWRSILYHMRALRHSSMVPW